MRPASERGYTLVEVLAAAALVVLVTAAVLAIVVPAQGVASTESELSDIQQRFRFGVATIGTELLMAGAGPSLDVDASFGHVTASLFPRRLGATNADTDDVAAGDRITIRFVPDTRAQTTLHDPLASPAGPISLDVIPGCPLTDAACGFVEGMTIVVFDETGAADVFRVTAVHGTVLDVQHNGGGMRSYRAGARVAELRSTTYWFDAAHARVMKYDGDHSDLPLLDHVVSLRFEYMVDPRAPSLIAPNDPARRSTTYGPIPPMLDADNPADAWPPGANCMFQVDAATSEQRPRLTDLGGAAGDLVPLAPALMRDGPWCPDDGAPNRFDADLLRIRLVRVTMRVEAARASLRGPAGVLFVRGGTARAASRIVPDQELRFDVAPRNLNLSR
jgi:hypothetical protein